MTTSIVLALLAFVAYFAGPIGTWIVLAIVISTLTLSVRGYSVMEGNVVVHRLGWSTRFPLREITGAEVHPHAMMGSLRTFGVGGLFAFVGRFRNTILGSYRAYATDGARTVVLERSSGGPVVVTPDRPAEFAREVRTRAGLPTD